MEAVRICINYKREGVMAITDPQEVLNCLLDNLIEATTEKKKKHALDIINLHEKHPQCIIPKSSKPFDWDENIYGKWDKS